MYSDKALATMVFCAALVQAFFLVLWAAVDVYKRVDVVTYRSEGRPPYYEIHQHCDSKHKRVWEAVLTIFPFLLVVILVLLAFKTRKIHRANYKDTKKVYAFLGITFCLASSTSTLSLFVYEDNPAVVRTLAVATYIFTVCLCQFLLFLPKTFPPLSRNLQKRLCRLRPPGRYTGHISLRTSA